MLKAGKLLYSLFYITDSYSHKLITFIITDFYISELYMCQQQQPGGNVFFGSTSLSNCGISSSGKVISIDSFKVFHVFKETCKQHIISFFITPFIKHHPFKFWVFLYCLFIKTKYSLFYILLYCSLTYIMSQRPLNETWFHQELYIYYDALSVNAYFLPYTSISFKFKFFSQCVNPIVTIFRQQY